VCVLHTTFDLLAEGFQVFLPVDASRAVTTLDHDIAFAPVEKAGAILTTCNSPVRMGRRGEPSKFKQISALVQERMKIVTPV